MSASSEGSEPAEFDLWSERGAKRAAERGAAAAAVRKRPRIEEDDDEEEEEEDEWAAEEAAATQAAADEAAHPTPRRQSLSQPLLEDGSGPLAEGGELAALLERDGGAGALEAAAARLATKGAVLQYWDAAGGREEARTALVERCPWAALLPLLLDAAAGSGGPGCDPLGFSRAGGRASCLARLRRRCHPAAAHVYEHAATARAGDLPWQELGDLADEAALPDERHPFLLLFAASREPLLFVVSVTQLLGPAGAAAVLAAVARCAARRDDTAALLARAAAERDMLAAATAALGEEAGASALEAVAAGLGGPAAARAAAEALAGWPQEAAASGARLQLAARHLGLAARRPPASAAAAALRQHALGEAGAARLNEVGALAPLLGRCGEEVLRETALRLAAPPSRALSPPALAAVAALLPRPGAAARLVQHGQGRRTAARWWRTVRAVAAGGDGDGAASGALRRYGPAAVALLSAPAGAAALDPSLAAAAAAAADTGRAACACVWISSAASGVGVPEALEAAAAALGAPRVGENGERAAVAPAVARVLGAAASPRAGDTGALALRGLCALLAGEPAAEVRESLAEAGVSDTALAAAACAEGGPCEGAVELQRLLAGPCAGPAAWKALLRVTGRHRPGVPPPGGAEAAAHRVAVLVERFPVAGGGGGGGGGGSPLAAPAGGLWAQFAALWRAAGDSSPRHRERLARVVCELLGDDERLTPAAAEARDPGSCGRPRSSAAAGRAVSMVVRTLSAPGAGAVERLACVRLLGELASHEWAAAAARDAGAVQSLVAAVGGDAGGSGGADDRRCARFLYNASLALQLYLVHPLGGRPSRERVEATAAAAAEAGAARVALEQLCRWRGVAARAADPAAGGGRGSVPARAAAGLLDNLAECVAAAAALADAAGDAEPCLELSRQLLAGTAQGGQPLLLCALGGLAEPAGAACAAVLGTDAAVAPLAFVLRRPDEEAHADAEYRGARCGLALVAASGLRAPAFVQAAGQMPRRAEVFGALLACAAEDAWHTLPRVPLGAGSRAAAAVAGSEAKAAVDLAACPRRALAAAARLTSSVARSRLLQPLLVADKLVRSWVAALVRTARAHGPEACGLRSREEAAVLGRAVSNRSRAQR